VYRCSVKLQPVDLFTVIVAECPRVHLTGAVYLLDILFRYLQNISTSLAEMLPAFLHPGDECNIEKWVAEGDTYTEKNPRFVPEGRWRMPRPSGTGFFTIYLFCNFGFYQDGDGRYEKEKYITRFTYTLLLSQLTAIIKGCSL